MTGYRNWHERCQGNTMWNLPTLERSENRLWKEAGLDLFYFRIFSYHLSTKSWDFLLRFFMCCQHCVFQVSWNIRGRHWTLREKLWFRITECGCHSGPQRPSSLFCRQGGAAWESKGYSLFLTSQQQSWIRLWNYKLTILPFHSNLL